MLLVASVAWLGAAPSTSLIAPPKIVVFPLTVNGEADKESGDRLATLFAQQLADNAVKVVPPPPGTDRKDFLTVARSLGCDYYVSGFVTPLGQEVTVVEQLVSTTSGTVIFSNSAQLLTYNDAAGQGQILAQAAIRHAIRGLASLGDAPVNAATPAPKETNEANIGGLFKRKPKAQATATPAPGASSDTIAGNTSASPRPQARATAAAATAAPAPAATVHATPAPRVAPVATATPVPVARVTPAAPRVVAAANGSRVVLFPIGGPAAADDRAYAARALEARLVKGGQPVAEGAAIDPAQLGSQAPALCSQNGAKALIDAQLSTRDGDRTYGPSTIAQFDIRAVDCTGRVLFAQHFEGSGTGGHNLQRAIESVVAAATNPLINAVH